MKLSAPALAGALVGTAALASFAAVPAEAAPSWSLSSLWSSATAGVFGDNKAQGGSFTGGGTRRGRRLPGNGMGNGNGNGMGNGNGNNMDVMDGMDDMGDMDGMDGMEYGMEEGDEFDYTGLTPEEIAEINGEDVDMGGMDDMGDMGMGMGMGMNNKSKPGNNKYTYLDHLEEDLPPYNGPADDPEQAEGMVGLESTDDLGEDPVAAEEAEKQAVLEAMDAQEAADEEFELDAAADRE